MFTSFRRVSNVACLTPAYLASAALIAVLAIGPRAYAQQPGQPENESTISESHQIVSETHHLYFGKVELERGDVKIYADYAEAFTDEDRVILVGNVLFVQGANRISADKAAFNTKTRLGTFYHATGMSTIKPPKQPPPRPGAMAPPPMTGEDTVVYFFGDTVEKIGTKKYKIVNGGFTTCVQPTPRWDLHAGSVILNIDHYTVLQQAVMTVKGVPMLYTPLLIYPTKSEDRATGFLLPTYGSSSLRGQSIHNAFFWAIDRSQDATFLHDYFSKTGQGIGTEYRYNYGAGSDGNISAYVLNDHAASYVADDGSTTTLPASRSYEIRGGANQMLPGNIRARARVDYFSSIIDSESFNTNISDASRNSRTFGGNLIGAWGTYTLNATLDHSEYFYDVNNSVLSGSWPRLQFTRNERPLLGSPLYFSMGGEYVHLLRDSRSGDLDVDSSLSRFDISPQIRYPFKKWQWFTVNSTASVRDTYYTRSQLTDPATNAITMLDDPINRRIFTVQSQIVGPVFNRIWDTPGNGYAEKFKHSIEPYVNVQYTTSVNNFDKIVQFDGIDSYVGGAQYTYGVNNRFYAKRKTTPGGLSQAREILDVELTQTYYTNQLASQYDRQYQFNGIVNSAPSNFSPIALNIRALPTNDLNANVRAEFDSRYHALRTISANTSYSWAGRVQTTVGWSKKSLIPELAGFNDPAFLDHYINTSTTLRTKDNHIGGVYSNNYDVLHSTMTNSRVSAFYNSQCCGIAFEYQTYNYGAGSPIPIPSDHRFFLSFTLAGLGNFSPFNGAMSGVPR